MGYHTDFSGEFEITPEIKPEHRDYINKFCDTRRITRDEKETAKRPDPIRVAAGLPVGFDGGYFVGAGGTCGQEWQGQAPGVIDSNRPPGEQPGLWCHWKVGGYYSDEESVIGWDGGEKFYHYVEWLEYLIEHFFKPWGYTLNGEVEWSGEERDDLGLIRVKDNVVTDHHGQVIYED